ncbi:MAG: hypothetical protein M3N41_07530 [Acidobacteriota bacterium]|nr:hypothetical protein [Acidobacteriota bacterium]
MRRVRLFHWNAKGAAALIARLRAAGFEAVHNAETQSPSVRELKESGAAAVVIDLSRMPSHGKYVGAWVRGSKSTRHLPLVFVGGESEKVAAIRELIPDAVYSTVAGVDAALKKAIARPPSDPVVPRQMMETAPGRTAAQKMGIREGSAVGLLDPPADYLKVLGVLPEGVVLEEDPRRACPVTVWFVHDPGEYEAALASRRLLAAKSRLWIVWQKGRRDGLNGNFVREAALAMGLVDYKICSLDGVWTGMVFAVKKARG